TAEGAGLTTPSPWGYIDSRRGRRVLAEAIERFSPDVVHLHNFYHLFSPGILAVLAERRQRGGPRVVATAHDFHLICPNAGLRFFVRGEGVEADPDRLGSLVYLLTKRWDHRGRAHSAAKLLQHLFNYRLLHRRRAIDTVIAPSRWACGVLERAGIGVAYVPNPVDVSPAPASARDIAHPAGGETRLVFAGRVEPEKGLAEFIAHLRGVEHLRIEIIGDGGDLERCRRAAADAGVEADFAGRLDRAETVRRIALADALVLPSLCAENAAMVLFEALASRTVPLVPDRGAPREIIEQFGVGAAFDPRSRESVLEALHAAREHSADWAVVAEKLEEWSPRRHAERLAGVYAGDRCGS
ncbi:MAG TPA: glycosyltransferase, partial [Phycisphaerales bacterium]|nr:glycosyltransferase [Phycisphaerales bacterium]